MDTTRFRKHGPCPAEDVDAPRGAVTPGATEAQVILSFDVEEHYRIEAAAGLAISPALRDHCRDRVAPPTYWLLERLEEHGLKATFFVVGNIAAQQPELVRAVHGAGHEVASHSWDHRRVLAMTPESFREDVRTSVDALEQVTGEAVHGYRAPTFSVVHRTAWAIDILAELGMLYDSSVYPVRHDRYGVPGAPRAPFIARGREGSLLEIPPATLRLPGLTVPVGGGGYFRLLPLRVLEYALARVPRECDPPVAMLFFHPWEFDTEQARLPLRPTDRFRTYVGVDRGRARLKTLLSRYQSSRAVDVARQLAPRLAMLPVFHLGTP